MNTIPCLLTLAAIPALSGMLCAGPPPQEPDSSVEIDPIYHDIQRVRPIGEEHATMGHNTGLTTDLYGQLRKSEGNVWFSPYSITEAMAMVHAGAKGNTRQEIGKAMHFTQYGKHVSTRLQMLRMHLIMVGNQKDHHLKIANGICMTGSSPLKSYQKILDQHYDAEVFAGGLEEINAWVNGKTEGKIETILEKLSPNSACVLLNAIYFKGNWKTPFKAHQTHDGKFTLADGSTVKVRMMQRSGRIQSYRGDNLVAVELPYQNGSSMVLMMPEKADGMAALEEGLDQDRLVKIYQQLGKNRPKQTQLSLPKFKLSTSYKLIDPMKSLGIKDAFDLKSADFSAMYDGNGVFISQIVHKATLEVDEMGSVASAATAVELSERGMTIKLESIHFDRPFLVAIMDRASYTTLFMGRVNDPTAK